MQLRAKPPYTVLAPVYNQMQEGAIDYRAWFALIEELLAAQGFLRKDMSKVLDLGCGTGTFTSLFAETGAFVIGVDRSPSMLAVAYDVCRSYGERVQLYEQDLRHLEIEGLFDLAVSCCDTLNYLTERSDFVIVCKNIRRHLKPGGYLLFDLRTSAYYREIDGRGFGRSEPEAAYVCETAYLREERLCRMHLTLFIKKGNGDYRREEEVHHQRFYSRSDTKRALNAAGLDLVGVHQSPQIPGRVLFLARNPSG